MTATFLQNHLPSRSVDSMPFERWFKRKPNMKDLKVFGCEAYVQVPSAQRRKMANKSRKLLFIGYCTESKAYRFLDPDAVFLELGSKREAEEVSVPVGERSTDVKVEFEKETEAEEVQSDNDTAEEFYGLDNSFDENHEATEPRRSTRTNIGVLPLRYRDYAVGLAAYSNEPAS